MNVHYETDRPVAVISLDRPAVTNAIDRPTADKLVSALQHFDADAELSVAVLEEQHPGRLCRTACQSWRGRRRLRRNKTLRG